MVKLRLLIFAFLLLLTFLSASVCLAGVTNTWTGDVDSDWFTGGNWSDGVPAAGQHVVITNVATEVLLTNSTANLASFNITSNTLTFTNWTTTLLASNVTIQSGGILTLPGAFTTNQMSNCVYVVCTNFTVEANGMINADSKGYARYNGPGKGGSGSYSGGGAYGGKGGNNYNNSIMGGSTYGSTNAPVAPGSGGGYSSFDGSGNGGGSVRIEATGSVTVNGTVTANGEVGTGDYGGGGSGGGICIFCKTFGGSTNGLLRADGADGGTYSGGGGGGRIAVGIGLSEEARNKLLNGEDVSRLYTYENHSAFAGTISVTNGTGSYNPPNQSGAPGTTIFLTTNYCLTITGNPANYGSPTPDGYGTRSDYADETWIWFTNSVNSPVDQGAGLRYACLGWDLDDVDGGYVSNGTSTQAVLEIQMTTNLVLTWNWTNEYELTVSSGNTNKGTVNTNMNGWYTNGVEVPGITATGLTGYAFFLWTGDVPSGKETDNPLTVTMDQVRTIQAQFYSLEGEIKTWTGSGNWESVTNWSPADMPGSYDDVIIESGSVLLSQSREVNSLTVSNSATLTFTNWATTLTASNVTIQSGGEITLPGDFTESQMSNRVHIVCTNFTLESGGTVDADEKGYAVGNGPGKGAGAAGYNGGGGYGGWGGNGNNYAGGNTYGSASAPIDPGSGGGPYGSGNDGGGMIRIEAEGNVTIDGTMTANGGNGQNGYGAGGGSGGGIYITCDTFGGSTNGTLRANGGDKSSTPDGGGGGGGGRIAVIYNSLAGQHSVRFSTCPGSGTYTSPGRAAKMGTLYFSDTNMLSETLEEFNGVLALTNFTSWSLGSFVISNHTIGFPDGFSLNVTSNLLITGTDSWLFIGTNSELMCNGDLVMTSASGQLLMDTNSELTCGGTLLNSGQIEMRGGNLVCGGDLILTNSGRLYVYSAKTNGLAVDYGALVSITNDMVISSNSWVYPYSHGTDGGSVLFRMRNLVIDGGTNGGFNADYKGYANNNGPGKGSLGDGTGNNYRTGGGGYGGSGGNGSAAAGTGGVTYGSTNAPLAPGSGAGGIVGGYGGGLVRIEAAGNVTVNGRITANGQDGGVNYINGGGSGGGIFIACVGTFGGSNGVLRAEGGDSDPHDGGDGGGGGGGRVAVWYKVSEADRATLLSGNYSRSSTAISYDGFSGTVSATNGVTDGGSGGTDGEPGTIVFLTVTPPSGTMFMCQ